MAENINIGNAGKDKNARALELYEAFSDVRGEYVDEMLDDRTAAEIRAANRRKSMRLRSSLAAFAAVIAIVIGISVIPHGKMESSGGSDKAMAPSNAAADNKKEDAPRYVSPAAEADEKSEEAPEYAEAPTNADDIKTPDEGEAGETMITTTMPPKRPETAMADNANDDGGSGDSPTDYAPAEEKADSDEPQKSEEAAPENTVFSVKITLDDGSEYLVAEPVGKEHAGKLITELEDGRKVYEFRDFSKSFMVAVEQNGSYYAALTDNFTRDTLEDLLDGLRYNEYLVCTEVWGSSTRADFDEQHLPEVSDWQEIFKDAGKTKPARAMQIDDGLTFLCYIGTESECFAEYIYITVYDNGVTDVSYQCGTDFIVSVEYEPEK